MCGMETTTLGERVRIARKAAGFTIEGLARAIDCSWRTVQRWEAADTTPETKALAAVATATGCDFAWLATGAPVAATEVAS